MSSLFARSKDRMASWRVVRRYQARREMSRRLKNEDFTNFHQFLRGLNRQQEHRTVVNYFNKFSSRPLSAKEFQIKLKCKEQMEYAELKMKIDNRVQEFIFKENEGSIVFWNLFIIALLAWQYYRVEVGGDMKDSYQVKLLPKKERSIEVISHGSNSYKFDDIKGIDEFKEEIQDIVDFFKNPKRYIQMGAKMPKGVLLTGPPGTGKTLLAKALANESGCNFIYCSASEFDEIYVGVGANRVKRIFAKAKESQPCIIFIDEFDVIGSARHYANKSQTLNQLLVEMDGFEKTSKVFIIAATNIPESLDPAVTRPGRIDKEISIPLPTIKGREAILRHYLQKIKHDEEDIDLTKLAKSTTGFSGADLENLVNLAAVRAVTCESEVVNHEHMESARDRIIFGTEKKNFIVPNELKKSLSYHHSAQAVVAHYTEGTMPIFKLSLLPRGQTVGKLAQLPEEDVVSYTRKNMLAAIDVALAGKVAEEMLVGPEKLTDGFGCGEELKKATNIAYGYIKNYGMSELGFLYIDGQGEQMSESYKAQIDAKVLELISESKARVKQLILDHKETVLELSESLLSQETLGKEAIVSIIAKRDPNQNSSNESDSSPQSSALVINFVSKNNSLPVQTKK